MLLYVHRDHTPRLLGTGSPGRPYFHQYSSCVYYSTEPTCLLNPIPALAERVTESVIFAMLCQVAEVKHYWNCVKRQWQVRRRWHSSIFHRSIPWFTSEVANPRIWVIQKLRLPEAGFFGCRWRQEAGGWRVCFRILAYRLSIWANPLDRGWPAELSSCVAGKSKSGCPGLPGRCY